MATTATISKKQIYLQIIDDYEKQKNQVLKNYLDKVAQIKKAGLKKLEQAMGNQDAKAMEKMIEGI